MKKSLKILSFVISIFIFFSFVGDKRVNAVAAGAVLGAEGISAAVSFLLSTIFTDSLIIAGNAAEQANYTVTVTTDDAQQILDDYFYSFNIDSLDGIDDYNCLMTITDPNQFLSYCGVSDPISLSGAQRTVYSSLQCTHNQVLNRKIITSAKGLVLQPISFSELLNDTSADLISYFSNSEAAVSFLNGIRHISIANSKSHYFPELCERFGALDCLAPDEDTGVFIVKPFTGTHYYVGISPNGKITSGLLSSLYSDPSLCTWDNSFYDFSPISFALDFYSSSSSYSGVCYFKSYMYGYSSVYGYHAIDMTSSVSGLHTTGPRTYSDSSRFSSISVDLGGKYLFEFDDAYKSNVFRDYMIDTSAGEYNPDDDVYTGDDVISGNLPFSDTEKKVDIYEQDHPGVDDIDIVVNPGAVKADDGTTTYNPSISVNDTPLDDIDVTGYLDLDDTLDRFQLPSSISTKFPFSLPFDIYNLFNVFSADPVTPKFTVPLDMTSVGGEVYNIDIDLSDFNDIANIVRWLLYGLFLIGLIILTNKLIGRG